MPKELQLVEHGICPFVACTIGLASCHLIESTLNSPWYTKLLKHSADWVDTMSFNCYVADYIKVINIK